MYGESEIKRQIRKIMDTYRSFSEELTVADFLLIREAAISELTKVAPVYTPRTQKTVSQTKKSQTPAKANMTVCRKKEEKPEPMQADRTKLAMKEKSYESLERAATEYEELPEQELSTFELLRQFDDPWN